MKSFDLLVGAAQSGMRLDVYLAELLAEKESLSRRKIRRIIDVGGVYINKKRIRIASRQVVRGDKVRVEYSEVGLKELATPKAVLVPESLIYDAFQVLAINKPPGMPSQATKDQSIQHVIPCLQTLLAQLHTPRRQLVLVHRLDKETSGVLLVAASAERGTWLMDEFRARHVKKTYLALCHGLAKDDEFSENAFLSPIDKRTGNVRVVHAGGRSALTRFRVLGRHAELGLSLIACYPESGRSHQIRVHLQLNGLPIVGDKRYAHGTLRMLPPELAELASVHHFLHAERLSFKPSATQAEVTIAAPLPPRFAEILAAVGLSASKN